MTNQTQLTPVIPRCPMCGSKRASVVEGGLYRCAKCDGLFDDDPDEGGDYSFDPTRRMQCQEAREQRRRTRRERP